MSNQPTVASVAISDEDLALSRIHNAYGLQITVTADSFNAYRKKIAEKHPEAHYSDVVIEHNGNRVEYTFEEFLERVGLK